MMIEYTLLTTLAFHHSSDWRLYYLARWRYC